MLCFFCHEKLSPGTSIGKHISKECTAVKELEAKAVEQGLSIFPPISKKKTQKVETKFDSSTVSGKRALSQSSAVKLFEFPSYSSAEVVGGRLSALFASVSLEN